MTQAVQRNSIGRIAEDRTPEPAGEPLELASNAPAPVSASPSPKILRFLQSERWLHWAIAVPFMICFATAVILAVFYNTHPLRSYRAVFSWIHRLSGICLVVLPPLVLFRGRREYRSHFENIRQAWIWSRDDLKWLLLSGKAALDSRISLPEQGKFNAAEKLNFMMVMGTYPLFIVTGVLIWLPGVAFFSWIAHLSLGVMVAPLMLGHIFMATVNPSTRIGLEGMITGFVDRRWAKHHYRKWYRENFESAEAPRPRSEVSPVLLQRPARVRCQSCSEIHGYLSWQRLLERVFEARSLFCPHCSRKISGISAKTGPMVAESILRHLEYGGANDPLAGEALQAA